MKIIEINLGTPADPVMSKRFVLFPGYSTDGVVNPRITLEPGVGIEEIATDADFEVNVGPDGRTVVDIQGTFPAGPKQPGGVLFQRYGDGDPIVEFTLLGDLSRTYDGKITGKALPGSAMKIGSMVFGNFTIKK